ncbi:PAS domain S-box protein [Novosphingobium aquimarinum]|uniref:PAS domain S-box protein n=1 Tax=Novosphingobium aquimarinum TaxID=2682494 RepID=UPI001E39E368|nr:PAS domain S-box protein [Novosphingobium aquimarinum]
MSKRILQFDWASTPVGPMDQWPASLTHTVAFMLASPMPMVLLWGEQGTMIYNDGYSLVAGERDSGLLGSAVREGWDEVADFNDHVMRVVLAGGTLSYRDQELTLHRNGQPEQVRMNLDYSPVFGDDGKPAGVIALVVETTEAVQAREALERSERRLRLLDAISLEVGRLNQGEDVLAATCRLTAEHLNVSNCAYADMDEDGQGFTIRGNWHGPYTPSIVGHYQLADFGALAIRELNEGRPLIINDNRIEISPEEARTFQAIGIAATICMPLVRQGKLVALMAIHDRVPRQWSEYELSVISEVTERSWAHIQRVAAENTLSERQAYHRQILDGAVDFGIIATDLDGRITLWNAGATQILGWTEAQMLGQPSSTFFTDEDRNEGRPLAKRREALELGRTQDARWHVCKSGRRFWGFSEMSPLRDGDGKAIGFVKVIRDRTAEHEASEALARSEDQLRRAQAAGGVGLFSIEIADNTIKASDEMCRIFGVTVGEPLTVERLEQLVIPGDRDKVSNQQRRERGETGLDVEFGIRRADDGELRILSRKAEFEYDAQGRPIRLIGVVQDITERRRTQRALERSEAQFSMLARNMPIHVWTARGDGTIDWLNDSTHDYCGMPLGSLVGRTWMRFVHREDLERLAQSWQKAIAGGEIFEAEVRLRDSEGNYRWHLARATPHIDASGSIAAWIGTNTEIEAQKQVEASYAQDRDRLWSISQDLMLVCDFDGRITALNPSAQRLLGWSEGEMLGQPIGNFVHPDDRTSTDREVLQLSDGARTLAFENRYRTKSGEYRRLSWTAVPSSERIHAVGRDITDQRAIEEALRQSQKMEAVGQLTGGIAHDFNNLLQGISGSLDMMQTRLSQGRAQDIERWLEGAKTSAARAAALTHRLLAFARRQPLDPRMVRANPLVSSLEDMLRRTMGETIAIDFVLCEDLWLTKCDPNQLENAVINLAINARDAMPDGGRLTVETCNAHLDDGSPSRTREVAPGQYVCICVTDTGMGMDETTLSRAIEPFFTTKPPGQGTGLGLSMIYGFARQSEGYVRIYSEPGQGTTVKLFLPRYLGGGEESTRLAAREDLRGAEDGEVVLVVEDEPVVRGLILEVLDELGYRAIEAEDGPQGVAILQSPTRIDLLVTDIGLPGLNGKQVAEAGLEQRPGLKVLFMTGYAENAARASGFLEEGMAMITKPFAMDVLANRIRDILED